MINRQIKIILTRPLYPVTKVHYYIRNRYHNVICFIYSNPIYLTDITPRSSNTTKQEFAIEKVQISNASKCIPHIYSH
jgi:hypothetical protein